ncbi:MAG: DNA-binding protein WhiA [Clostridia bacterium]|nr:DNA-binding protein WhiA [Clostridia bacterium]
MSYSYDIKEELSNFNNWKNEELLKAEFLGYILTGNALSDGEFIEFVTENEYNIERFYKILFHLKIDYEPETRGKCLLARIANRDIENIFAGLAINPKDEVKKTILRGSFLGAGSCTDPEKNYHLEILFGDKKNSEYIANLAKTYGVEFKSIQAKDKVMLYVKEADQVSSFLACIGANKAVLRLEDIRVFKEMKNNVNRMVNCETANLNKTVDAAVSQIEDIKFLQKINRFEELSPEVREVALLRLEHPESSLKELGEMLTEPIGKSGINHRLKKIQNLAEELRK